MVKKKKFDVDAFNQGVRQEKHKELTGRRATEQQLWEKWHKGGRKPADLVPLMKSMEPLVKSEARKYQKGYGGSLVGGANEAELRRRLLQAINTYQPTRGTQLSTHTINKFRSMSDVARKRRNFVRMSNQDTDKFAPYHNAVNALKVRGTLHPSHMQIAQELKWPSKKGIDRVRRMEAGIRKEMFTAGPGTDEATTRTPSQARSIAALVVFRNEEERKIFKALKLDNSQLEVRNKFTMQATAKRMGIPYSRFARIRERLKKRVQHLAENT